MPSHSSSRSSLSDSDRRLRQACRVARTLDLLQTIAAGPPPSVADLARQLECSERTVHRDLRTLELAGIPIWFDRDAAGYRLRFDGPLASSLRALFRSEPSEAAQEKRAARQVLSWPVRSESWSAAIDERADLIERSIAGRRLVTGIYRSPYEAEPVTSSWQPLRLLTHRDVVYVIARDQKHTEPRTYRLDRFESLRSMTTIAAEPIRFSLDHYFLGAWRIYRGCRPEQVTLRTRHPDRIAAELDHPSVKLLSLADGQTQITLTVGLSPDFLRCLFAHLDVVTVVGPRSLLARLAQQSESVHESLNIASSRSGSKHD